MMFLGFLLFFEWRANMSDQINRFLDLIRLVANRLPDLYHLIVELALLGLLLAGLRALFKKHP